MSLSHPIHPIERMCLHCHAMNEAIVVDDRAGVVVTTCTLCRRMEWKVMPWFQLNSPITEADVRIAALEDLVERLGRLIQSYRTMTEGIVAGMKRWQERVETLR